MCCEVAVCEGCEGFVCMEVNDLVKCCNEGCKSLFCSVYCSETGDGYGDRYNDDDDSITSVSVCIFCTPDLDKRRFKASHMLAEALSRLNTTEDALELSMRKNLRRSLAAKDK